MKSGAKAVILIGGVGASVGLIALARKKPEEEPPWEDIPPWPDVPPENGEVARFYMPPTIEYTLKEVEIVGIPYNRITVSCPITNVGGAPGTHSIDVYFYWNGTQFSDVRKTFTLQPGDTYTYTKTVDVWRSKQATCKIYGDWGENNYSEVVVAAGEVPWEDWENIPPWEDIPPWEEVPWEEVPWEKWDEAPPWDEVPWDAWDNEPWYDWDAWDDYWNNWDDAWDNEPWGNWSDGWNDYR